MICFVFFSYNFAGFERRNRNDSLKQEAQMKKNLKQFSGGVARKSSVPVGGAWTTRDIHIIMAIKIKYQCAWRDRMLPVVTRGGGRVRKQQWRQEAET
jgi:hypothetical protein